MDLTEHQDRRPAQGVMGDPGFSRELELALTSADGGRILLLRLPPGRAGERRWQQ